MKTLTCTIIIFYLFYWGPSDENEFFLDKTKSFGVVQIHQKKFKCQTWMLDH